MHSLIHENKGWNFFKFNQYLIVEPRDVFLRICTFSTPRWFPFGKAESMIIHTVPYMMVLLLEGIFVEKTTD